MKYLNPHNAIIELERLVSSNDSEIKLQSNGETLFYWFVSLQKKLILFQSYIN